MLCNGFREPSSTRLDRGTDFALDAGQANTGEEGLGDTAVARIPGPGGVRP
jgi:hypothetical protein